MLAKSIFVSSLLLLASSAAAKPPKTSTRASFTTKTTFVTVTPAPTSTTSLGPPCVGWQGDTTYCGPRSGCWTYWKSGTVDGRCINTAHE
ncbi:hypothetical protein TWF506_010710 [Arthrobotrys conoides]|uniref:Uncharacterized protein n=1 Tax=Arthrobotrys conoides TaxID=74498 RepID=A0AAN8N210_9PEZI